MNLKLQPLDQSKVSFQTSLDRRRPYELIGDFSETSAVIRYKYTDTNERVTVPNNWCNRPAKHLIQHAKERASSSEERARRLEESPPVGLNPEAVQSIVAYHRQNAAAELKNARTHLKEVTA